MQKRRLTILFLLLLKTDFQEVTVNNICESIISAKRLSILGGIISGPNMTKLARILPLESRNFDGFGNLRLWRNHTWTKYDQIGSNFTLQSRNFDGFGNLRLSI